MQQVLDVLHACVLLHAVLPETQLALALNIKCFDMMLTALAQWEREVQLYIALKQLPLFNQHKLWKAFQSWKHSISTKKQAASKVSLNKQLFLLSPVFQSPLQRFHMLCLDLSSMRVHNLKPGQVYLEADAGCRHSCFACHVDSCQ